MHYVTVTWYFYINASEVYTESGISLDWQKPNQRSGSMCNHYLYMCGNVGVAGVKGIRCKDMQI